MKRKDLINKLSKSEKELLFYIEKGYTKRRIAKALYKTHGTVKCQVNKILKKLDVKSSKEAVRKVNFL